MYTSGDEFLREVLTKVIFSKSSDDFEQSSTFMSLKRYDKLDVIHPIFMLALDSLLNQQLESANGNL